MEPGCREGDGHTLGAEGGRAPTGASLSAASKSFSLSVQLYISILSGRCIFVSAQAFKSHTTAGLRKNCQVPGGNVWSHRAQPRIPSILCIPPPSRRAHVSTLSLHPGVLKHTAGCPLQRQSGHPVYW